MTNYTYTKLRDEAVHTMVEDLIRQARTGAHPVMPGQPMVTGTGYSYYQIAGEFDLDQVVNAVLKRLNQMGALVTPPVPAAGPALVAVSAPVRRSA